MPLIASTVSSGKPISVLYVMQVGEIIVVLHAFEKKTQKTAKRDLDFADARLRSWKAKKR